MSTPEYKLQERELAKIRPWDNHRGNAPALRMGVRRLCYVDIEECQTREARLRDFSVEPRRQHGQYIFYQSVDGELSFFLEKISQFRVCFQAWVDSPTATPDEIERLKKLLYRDVLPRMMEPFPKLKPAALPDYLGDEIQEFIDVRLPQALSAPIDQHILRSDLIEERQRKCDATLESSQFTTARLALTGEHYGSIDTAARYIRTQTRAIEVAPPDKILDTPPYKRFILVPLIAAALLLAAWAVPLNAATIVIWSLLFLSLIPVSLIPWFKRKVPWNRLFYRLRITATGLFLFIALFGTLYAIDALNETRALPLGISVSQLGYAYLVATGITFTSGLVSGTLQTDWARFIAHVQMLFFMTGLGAAVAALLNIKFIDRGRGPG